MEWWNMQIAQAEKLLQTDCGEGLSEEEASRRGEINGKNRLEQTEKKKGILWKFLAQFQDFMILLLIGAAVLSFAVSRLKGEGDFLEPAIIIAIMLLNAFLGVLQESRAEKALEALQSLAAPKARVRRGGKEQMIPAEDVVVGDVLLLSAGDYICADGRLFESRGLKTEESA
ncbi:MAG: cation-transporting P-type ATPase, partial [Bacillota bacterium]|nr:cation-transporting P-type ATPase [Bacillota bacterium]